MNEKVKNYKKANLGKKFENAINLSCEYYRLNNIAIIYKKQTPIKIANVSYPKRSEAKITEAYFAIPSTTDYNGIYKGYYIDFEAKSTLSDYFSFNRIYPHQMEHLKATYDLGGITFLLILFQNHNEIYLLETKDIYPIYKKYKGIIYKKIISIGHKVNIKYTPPIDFITQIDEIIKKH